MGVYQLSSVLFEIKIGQSPSESCAALVGTRHGRVVAFGHVYGALPPHRNMGYLALLIGAGYAVVMIAVYQRNVPRHPIT